MAGSCTKPPATGRGSEPGCRRYSLAVPLTFLTAAAAALDGTAQLVPNEMASGSTGQLQRASVDAWRSLQLVHAFLRPAVPSPPASSVHPASRSGLTEWDLAWGVEGRGVVKIYALRLHRGQVLTQI
jgi:hypothetical protein